MFININHKECLMNLLNNNKERYESLLNFMESKKFIITKIEPIAKTSNKDIFIIVGLVKMELKQGGFGYVLTRIRVSIDEKKNKFNYKYNIR